MALNEYPVSVYGDIGGQSRQAAETYNRVTLAMERVIEIERAAGVKAFAVAEKFVALR